MGTKNNPGKFDCYVNAKPDEPMFVLLGRDRVAGALVRRWVELRKDAPEQAKEALACAEAMDKWAIDLQKEPLVFDPREYEVMKLRAALTLALITDDNCCRVCGLRMPGEHDRDCPGYAFQEIPCEFDKGE